MSAELLFAIGTLLLWIGWIGVIRAAFLGVAWLVRGPADVRRKEMERSILRALLIGGFALFLGLFFPRETGRELATQGWHLPLVWVLMPFGGWLLLGSIAGVVIRLAHGFSAVSDQERAAKLRAAAIWAAVGIGSGIWWFGTGAEATIFRGALPVNWTVVITLLVLALAAMAVMVRTERAARERGIAKRFATHLVLIAGTIIFGLPFAWLMITSFKEDRDMVSEEGIVWVPQVQLTVPYLNPDDPIYQFRYDNRTVAARIEQELPNGNVLFEIDRPLGMRGLRVEQSLDNARIVPVDAPIWEGEFDGQIVTAFTQEDQPDGNRRLEILEPENLKGVVFEANPTDLEPVRQVGLRWQNYTEALEFLPRETFFGLRYLQNTLIIVIFSTVGTLLSSSIVAYAFSRMRFPAKNVLFGIMLATLMLPGAVTMLPTFLIFRSLGWIDTLLPLWVPAFFASAFNVFLLRQFFMQIPMELEDAAKIDGCTYLRTYWQVMMPQIKPALAVIAIWTFMGAWNNFMGPLIYVSSPERMPIAYAIQLFQGERGGEYGLMMAFATMAILPVLLLFFFAQKYFIEGVQLSGLGGR